MRLLCYPIMIVGDLWTFTKKRENMLLKWNVVEVFVGRKVNWSLLLSISVLLLIFCLFNIRSPRIVPKNKANKTTKPVLSKMVMLAMMGKEKPFDRAECLKNYLLML